MSEILTKVWKQNKKVKDDAEDLRLRLELRNDIDEGIKTKTKDLMYYVDWAHDSLGVDASNDILVNMIILLHEKIKQKGVE